MRLAYFNFAGQIIWKISADDPALFPLPGTDDWLLVNPLYYFQLPILARQPADAPFPVGGRRCLLFNSELVFAAVRETVPTKGTEDDLIHLARGLLLRLRHVSGQAALPVSDSHLLGIGYSDVADLPKLPPESWPLPFAKSKTQKYMLDTAITAKRIDEAVALGTDFTPPTHEALLLDAILAYRDNDYRRAILYAAISCEVAFGSVIEDAYSRILTAKNDERFRVIDLQQAGGKTIRKDPIYERLQNRSDFNTFIGELSLYVLGRSLLAENQTLFASAKRLYSTRNQIVHSGALMENESDSTYPLDEKGAWAALETAISLFTWLGIRDDFALPKIEFVPTVP